MRILKAIADHAYQGHDMLVLSIRSADFTGVLVDNGSISPLPFKGV